MMDLRSHHKTDRMLGGAPGGSARIQVRMQATSADTPVLLETELPAVNPSEHDQQRGEAEGLHPQLEAGWQLS